MNARSTHPTIAMLKQGRAFLELRDLSEVLVTSTQLRERSPDI